MFQKTIIIILPVIINVLDNTYKIPNPKDKEDLKTQFYMFRKELKKKYKGKTLTLLKKNIKNRGQLPMLRSTIEITK